MASNIKNESIQGDLSVSRNTTIGGELQTRGNAEFDHDVLIKGWLKADNIIGECKGLFASEEALGTAYPRPTEGWYAFVGGTLPADVYRAENGKWVKTGEKGGETNVYLDSILSDINSIKAQIDSIERKIDISAGFAVLDSYNAYDKCGIYRLTISDGTITAGILVVTSDNYGHVISQWLVGNYTIRDGAVTGEHSDGAHTLCVRCYGIMPSSSAVTKGQWTAWEYAVGDPEDKQTKWPSILEWSGIVVEGVAYSTMSIVASGVAVYDKLKKSFLLQVQASSGSFTYFNNWAGRELLQDNIYAGNAMNDIRQVKGVLEGTLSQLSPSLEDILQGKTVTLTASNVYIYDGKVVYSNDPSVSYMLISDSSYFMGAKNYVDSNGSPLSGAVYLTDNGRMFSADDYGELSEISPFNAGFKPNVYYKGTNGDVWIATGSDQLTKLFSANTQSITVDDELSQTSKNPVQNRVITETIKNITSWNDADNNKNG